MVRYLYLVSSINLKFSSLGSINEAEHLICSDIATLAAANCGNIGLSELVTDEPTFIIKIFSATLQSCPQLHLHCILKGIF
jgi:hypothetical protein